VYSRTCVLQLAAESNVLLQQSDRREM